MGYDELELVSVRLAPFDRVFLVFFWVFANLTAFSWVSPGSAWFY